jgi:hypothetical protein
VKKKVKMAFKLSAMTTMAFLRVGFADPAIGDFPSTMGLALFQGVLRSSGSGAPPTARCLRRSRDLVEGGVRCNFLFSLGLSVRTVA